MLTPSQRAEQSCQIIPGYRVLSPPYLEKHHENHCLTALALAGTAHAGKITVEPAQPLRGSEGMFRCALWAKEMATRTRKMR